MAQSRRGKHVAPVVIERLIKQLNITWKAVKLYPLSSAIPRDSAAVALDVLRGILQTKPAVQLEVSKEGFAYEKEPVYPDHPAFSALAREFYARGIAEIRFHSGCTESELVSFLSVIEIPAEQLSASGGFETRLWDLGVNNITVRETSTRIVDSAAAAKPAEEEDELPADPRVIDEIVSAALNRRPRAQRMLIRFVSDARALGRYLAAPSLLPTGPQDAAVARRVADLARAIRSEDPEGRGALDSMLADALRSLDRTLLRDTLRQLLGAARHDETVATVLRELTLDELSQMLMSGLDMSTVECDDLARTVRNLISLGMGSREDTVRAAESAMRLAGADDAFVTGVLAESAPSRLRVRERVTSGVDKPVEVVLRLLDIAGTNVAVTTEEATGLDKLREESRAGITDGDVMGALVTLVTIEDRPEEFASVMSLMENNLGLLVERQEFEVAADAAESLSAALHRQDLGEAQQRRIRKALTSLAEPGQMRLITAAMRLHRPESAEHQACRRLLGVLGEQTIGALLEVLAAEEDMTARKSMVDLISGMAARFLDDLGTRLSDPRWYFVRNVVSIIGSTRSAEALGLLERTLRHSDARVRRETIRAVSSIRDARAEQMLAAALDDDDAGNVQLAARYLGSMKARGAVGALERVARGEGHGNRDGETRIDAIEALGRIGAASSTVVLEEISKQRSLRAGRQRELRAAAQSALAAVRAAQKMEGRS